jgi:hypothetical protein
MQSALAFGDVTYRGPAIEDQDIFERLPKDLQTLLGHTNGFVAFDGGIHVRGACLEPDWHSIRTFWMGSFALHERYTALTEDDIPFAEDCVGDQFLLRSGQVILLDTETGEVEVLANSLLEFLEKIQSDPQETLGMHPLIGMREEDGEFLEPGQLINVFPPFCTKEAAEGVAMSPVPTMQRLDYLVELSKVMSDLDDGHEFVYRFTE